MCQKLSNSGDTLKPFVLNQIWKYLSGWSNYSGIVISEGVEEMKMGYRGSKSTMLEENIVVKEQRVDGSCIGAPELKKNLSMLRCTLMGLERDYQNKVLSKSLIRYYSTKVVPTDTSQIKESKLDPHFVSGFIDGEGSFSVVFIKDNSYKSGWQIKTSFSIGLHIKDFALLEEIKNFFCVGGISKKGVNGIQYYVNSPKDLLVIENHLNNYPLLTQKQADFILFKSILDLIRRKEHLTEKGLNEIVSWKALMNRGLTSTLEEAFTGIILKERPIITYSGNLSPGWLAGFTSAEGSFMVRILNSPKHKLNKKVQLEFNLSQHARDEQLMKEIANYFGAGAVYLNRNAFVYRVFNFTELIDKILPLFKDNLIQGIKYFDYLDFLKAVNIIRENRHLTLEGLEEIQKIKNGMNSRRDICINDKINL